MKKYIIEFIGTFFLTLIVAMTGNPLAIGGVLAVMVYMGGDISGANYNPAVSLALVIRGKLPFKDLLFYVPSQILGSIVAILVYIGIKGSSFAAQPPASSSALLIIATEILFTFALCFVVLMVATRDEVKGNQYFGLAIGGVLAVIALAGGPLSGGVYNPAIALGTNIASLSNTAVSWIAVCMYVLSEFLGAALAALLFLLVNRPETSSTDEQPVTRTPIKNLTQIISKSLVKNPQ